MATFFRRDSGTKNSSVKTPTQEQATTSYSSTPQADHRTFDAQQTSSPPDIVDDGFVHIEIPSDDNKSSRPRTPSDASRQLGESEPIFKMSDLSIDKGNYEDQQQEQQGQQHQSVGSDQNDETQSPRGTSKQ